MRNVETARQMRQGVQKRLSIAGIARGGLFLLIGSVISSILGYVFLFLISQMGGPGIVGITSVILSLSSVLTGIATIGVPTGVIRFLGREFNHKNNRGLNTYFWSSFILTLILCLIPAVVISVLPIFNLQIPGFSQIMLVLTGVLTFLGFSTIFDALIVSTIKTEFWVVSYVASGVVKIVLGVFLVYIGLGWQGAVMAVIFATISATALMLFFALRELRHLGGAKLRFSSKAMRESLHAGSVNWLPAVIALLGQQLGTLSVLGLQGYVQAGLYYISYVIFNIVYMLPNSFTSFVFPVLSGSTNEGKTISAKVLKLCLALACPFVAFLIVYSTLPLSLIGSQYVGEGPTLCLLASSIVPLVFVSVVTGFMYASGSYGAVLGIGLAVSVPRVVLYLIFVPIYSGFGAALSFLIGSITGLGAVTVVSRRVGLHVPKMKLIAAIAVPSLAALLSYLVRLDWYFGGAALILASVFFYARLGVVERADLSEIAKVFASEKTINKAGERLSWLLRILYGNRTS